MGRYLLRRLLHVIPLLGGIALLSFGLLKLAPGDFLTQMALNPEIAPETIDLMRRQFGLDQPWYVQFGKWIWGMVRGDLGYSFTYRIPVAQLIADRVVNTLILSLAAALTAWLIAIPLGVWAALRQGSWVDDAISFFAFATISVPSFFLALLGLFLAAGTGWFPTGGTVGVGYASLDAWGRLLDRLHHLALPALILGIAGLGGLLRVMRGSMLETLRQPYVAVARAKGLPPRTVTWRHVFPNAMNPLVTLLGFEIAALLSGAAFTEIIFAWPGLGRLILEAVMSQDLYLVMGSLLMGSVLLITGNLLADLLLARIDPRIKLG